MTDSKRFYHDNNLSSQRIEIEDIKVPKIINYEKIKLERFNKNFKPKFPELKTADSIVFKKDVQECYENLGFYTSEGEILLTVLAVYEIFKDYLEDVYDLINFISTLDINMFGTKPETRQFRTNAFKLSGVPVGQNLDWYRQKYLVSEVMLTILAKILAPELYKEIAEFGIRMFIKKRMIYSLLMLG
jgi:hypothetical protein